MRQQKQNYILISAFLITVCAGIFLPGILLHYTFQANLNETKPVPKDYYNYSSSVISKNASNKLSEFEKIKLISGAWKSSQTPVDFSYSTITQTQAADYAKNAVSDLYKAKLYPYHFDSEYGNWYSWKASLFQYTETTFNTYSAYCWLITFYKYDSTEIHDVLITENGTLLSIRTNRTVADNAIIKSSATATDFSTSSPSLSDQNWHNSMKHYYNEKYKPVTVSFLSAADISNFPMYQQTALEKPVIDSAYVMLTKSHNVLTWADFNNLTSVDIPKDTEIYYIYRSHTDKQAAFTLIPWE